MQQLLGHHGKVPAQPVQTGMATALLMFVNDALVM